MKQKEDRKRGEGKKDKNWSREYRYQFTFIENKLFSFPSIFWILGACGSGSVYGECCQPFHLGSYAQEHLRS